MHSGLCRLFTIPQGDFSLRFYRSAVSATLWASPDAYRRDRELLRAYLRPGDRVVDVGANVGVLAVASAVAVGEAGRVLAIEPHPRTASFLRGNVALNRLTNVDVEVCALGADPGSVRFTDRTSDEQNHVSRQRSASTIEVSVRTLDSLFAAPALDLLKIDVEGYELPVLLGAARTLARTRCVYFESGESHFTAFGYRTEDVLALLDRAGFSCYRRLGLDVLQPLARGYVSTKVENLLAIREPAVFCARTGWRIDS
jgi:FkbM family methyltransferase